MPTKNVAGQNRPVVERLLEKHFPNIVGPGIVAATGLKCLYDGISEMRHAQLLIRARGDLATGDLQATLVNLNDPSLPDHLLAGLPMAAVGVVGLVFAVYLFRLMRPGPGSRRFARRSRKETRGFATFFLAGLITYFALAWSRLLYFGNQGLELYPWRDDMLPLTATLLAYLTATVLTARGSEADDELEEVL